MPGKQIEVVTLTKEAFEAIAKRLEQLESRFDLPARQLGQEKLYTVSEAARILQVSQRTLLTYRNQGQIKFVQLGKAVRFRKQDLSTFIERRKQ